MSLLDPTVAPREARATALATGEPMDNFGVRRSCASDGCTALLSRYNPATTCSVHRGWRAVEHRPRRRS